MTAPTEPDPSTATVEEMTDAEAIETLVRTDEEHLTEGDDTPEQVTVDASGQTLPGVSVHRTQGTQPMMFHVMSEIDDGVFVAWDFCRRDGKPIALCTCKQGPEEPKYVTRWRKEWIAKRDAANRKAVSEVMQTALARLSDERRDVEQADEPSAATVADDTPAPSEEETA